MAISRPAKSNGPLTDWSGTTIIGSKIVMPYKAERVLLWFQNISDTDMYLNFDGAAAAAASTSFKVKPDAELRLDGTFAPDGAVTVYCASAGKVYVAKEG